MFKLHASRFPNGTVLVLGVRYAGRPDDDPDTTRGRTSPKVFTYAALKAGGLWYLTGAGKVPTAAGWPAVERWLARDGREVMWARIAGHGEEVYRVDNFPGTTVKSPS